MQVTLMYCHRLSFTKSSEQVELKLLYTNLSTLMMMMNCFVVWLTEEWYLALFPVGTIVRDPHYRESPTRREQGLNECRT